MKKVLIAYTTNAGSTTDVAKTIGETLRQGETQVDICHIKDTEEVSTYDAIIVGGPKQLMGWHRDAVKFLQKHQKTFSRMPVAYFFTSIHLTKTSETSLGTVSIYRDPAVALIPKNENKLSFKEKQTTVEAYLKPVLKKVPLIKPVSVGFFAGKLDYSKLNIFHKLLLKLIIREAAGDHRNWDAIREWASSLNL